MHEAPFDPVEFASAHERREAQMLAQLCDATLPLGDVVAGRSVPGMWNNYAIGFGDAEVDGEVLERIAEFYQGARMRPRIDASNHCHGSLLRALAAGGFSVQGFQNMLSHSLDALPRLELPAGYTIGPLEAMDPPERDALLELDRAAFAPTDELAGPQREVTLRVLAASRHRALVIRHAGQLVGAGFVDVGAEHAYLFAGNVHHAHRHRGLHQALVVGRMQLARSLGATSIAVSSAPFGPTERNARRLGFQLAYVRVSFGAKRA